MILATFLGVTVGFADAAPVVGPATAKDGVYVNREVEKGAKAIPNIKLMLELNDGRFRYWVRHNTTGVPAPKLPYVGKYTTLGDTVTLHTTELDPRIDPISWTFKTFNGVLTLWPTFEIAHQTKEKRIPLEMLLRETVQVPEDIWVHGHR